MSTIKRKNHEQNNTMIAIEDTNHIIAIIDHTGACMRTRTQIKNNISKSIVSNTNFIKKYSSRFYIISGGFKEIIYPIVKSFGIKENQIYANEFIYNKKDVISINKKNALSKDMGKVQIANQIEGINIIIGDGYTDFEVKKEGAAEYFIQYTETINRKKLNSRADCIANNFNQVINYLCAKFN